MVDGLHVWGDPAVEESIAAAAGRIAGFQVCDQFVALPDPLMCRALPGAGPIDHRHLRSCVEPAGHAGPVEVEVFSADLSARPGAAVLAEVIASYRDHVAP